jgi:hypothetical protein
LASDTQKIDEIGNNGKKIILAEISLRQLEIISLLQEVNTKVDALQKGQAKLRPDIVEHVCRILMNKWKEDAVKRRERCWD